MTAPDWPHPLLIDDDVIFIDLSLNKTLRSDRVWVQDIHWLWRGRPAVWARYVVQQWNTFTFLSRTLSMVILTPHIFHRLGLGLQFTSLRRAQAHGSGWSWSAVWAHITHHNQYWVIHNRPLPNPCDIKTSKLKPAQCTYCTQLSPRHPDICFHVSLVPVCCDVTSPLPLSLTQILWYFRPPPPVNYNLVLTVNKLWLPSALL